MSRPQRPAAKLAQQRIKATVNLSPEQMEKLHSEIKETFKTLLPNRVHSELNIHLTEGWIDCWCCTTCVGRQLPIRMRVKVTDRDAEQKEAFLMFDIRTYHNPCNKHQVRSIAISASSSNATLQKH